MSSSKKPARRSNKNTPAEIHGRDPVKTAESRRWKQKMEELARQTREARQGLVEKVAQERAFQGLEVLREASKVEDLGELLDNVTDGYLDGRFFLTELSLFYDVAPDLSLTVFMLRQEWIRQYDLQTVPELMLLDQTMLAYFHVVRLNKEIANLLSLAEFELYGADSPWVRVKRDKNLKASFEGLEAEKHIRALQERLTPLLERFNQMFLRNLKAMRELKSMPVNINIGQAGQVNVAQQQVNMQEDKAEK